MNGTFNKDLYNAALASKGMTQEELAQKLGISRNCLLYKIKRGGNFKRDEIVIMYQLFSKKTTDAFLYD